VRYSCTNEGVRKGEEVVGRSVRRRKKRRRGDGDEEIEEPEKMVVGEA